MVKTKAIAPEGTSPTGDSVKKPAVKRAIKSKTTSELHKNPKPIKRAEPGREFHLVDGRNVADLKELADMLDDMSIAVWNHHVNQGRNDFANWV